MRRFNHSTDEDSCNRLSSRLTKVTKVGCPELSQGKRHNVTANNQI